jgi:hypothetical protein
MSTPVRQVEGNFACTIHDSKLLCDYSAQLAQDSQYVCSVKMRPLLFNSQAFLLSNFVCPYSLPF